MRITKHNLTAAMAAVAILVGGVFTFTGVATASTPASYETPWTNGMNQETYWETAFATPGRTVSCTKYSNHGGNIPADVDAAVIKDGSAVVKVYPDLTNVGAFTATGAINPNNGKPYEAPHSWIMKCKFRVVTTTTTSTSTTSTTSTTTTVPVTTSTVPETTTTTSTSTTTTVPETTTTVPETTTSTVPETTSTVPQTSSTVVEAPPVAPATAAAPTELAYTGTNLNLFLAGLALLALGGVLVFTGRRKTA